MCVRKEKELGQRQTEVLAASVLMLYKEELWMRRKSMMDRFVAGYTDKVQRWMTAPTADEWPDGEDDDRSQTGIWLLPQLSTIPTPQGRMQIKYSIIRHEKGRDSVHTSIANADQIIA